MCAVLFAARGTTSGFATTKRAGEREKRREEKRKRSGASEIETEKEMRGEKEERERERERTERTEGASFEKSLMESLEPGMAVRARARASKRERAREADAR